eukprot:1145068-Pelagomonas_calceolata.AAC.2
MPPGTHTHTYTGARMCALVNTHMQCCPAVRTVASAVLQRGCAAGGWAGTPLCLWLCSLIGGPA